MPYQGDRVQEQPPKFTTDFAYLKKLPGALVLVQMVCSGLGFLLALGSSMVWNVKAGHGFFTFVSFMCFLSSICWLAVHVFQLYTLFKTTINWNKVGLVYNGVNTFLLMVASCFMVEVASRARVLRAAGVFGFFGFTGFLAGLVWEVLVWHKNRDGGPGFSTASVVRGPDRRQTQRRGDYAHANRARVAAGGLGLLPQVLHIIGGGAMAHALPSYASTLTPGSSVSAADTEILSICRESLVYQLLTPSA